MVSVTCLAATKIAPVSYSWNKDGKSLDEPTNNIRFSNTNELSVIIIDPVSVENSGNYTCTATNFAGTDSYMASLKVKAHPRWIAQPTDIVATLGSSIISRCHASGSPNPMIKWTKISDLLLVSADLSQSTKRNVLENPGSGHRQILAEISFPVKNRFSEHKSVFPGISRRLIGNSFLIR
ncbi:hemicentin-1 [Caerostris extrusa]|uniref:Hemicentin-1 n=1 Tax=Caerostris extrusa TaxID=172846 RepID=A0AAV4QLS7_CAEEX|nr:hemicentin-1 [Caerostris extrusa]